MEPKKLLPSEYQKHGLRAVLEIPEPPKQLWYTGTLPKSDLTLLAIVGSRQYTPYGKQVLDKLVAGLAGYKIGIVSGLAIGFDTLAHEAALKNDLYTLAVPGSGLNPNVIYPARNKALAERIVASGGCLISEFAPDMRAAIWTFPQRNRIVVGLIKATLIIEAGAKSGTLITARLTVDYNRELLAVPGNIFSPNSHGTHQFIKLGATVVTDSSDILMALNIDEKEQTKTIVVDTTPLEARVLKILTEPRDKDAVIRLMEVPVSEANTCLMQMEIKGFINYAAPFYHKLI